MKVLPAPLEPTLQAFTSQMTQLHPYFKRFSIDIQDGQIVPTKSVDISDVVEYFKTNTETYKDTILDFDLMTYDYKAALDKIATLATTIQIGNIFIFKSAIKAALLPTRNGLSIGLSLNPQDTVEDLALEYNLNSIPCIQIMTIHAGPQGQPFIPDMLKKVDQLKGVGYRSSIYLDGAINKDSISVIQSRSNLPDFLCVGSYLTKAGAELEERVKYIKSIEQ